MLFNARERRIIDLLILYGEATFSDFTEYFDISERTLRRSLSSINDSLLEFNLEIIVKNDYVYLIGNNENKNRLTTMLDRNNDLSDLELKSLIIHKIFYDDEVSILSLSYLTGFSVYTINKIMDQIKSETKNNFDYFAEKGKGIQIDLNESYKRKLLHKYINMLALDHLSEFILGFNSDGLDISNKIITECLNLNLTYKVEKIIHENIINKHKRKLTDDVYLSAVLMISISLERIENGFYISSNQSSNISNQPDYESNPVVNELLALVTDNILVTQNESHYFIKLYFQLINDPASTIDYESLAARLIQKVEDTYRVDLSSKLLQHDLVQHFQSFNGKQIIGNTFYEKKLIGQIKNEYYDLFQTIESEMISILGTENVTDEQIVFIVLHFGVELIEHNIDVKRRKKILAICSSGMGSSKMMASILNTQLDNVNIHSASVYKLYNQIDMSKYDLIVATINLGDVPVPYVVVSPLITENQMKVIKNKLNDE